MIRNIRSNLIGGRTGGSGYLPGYDSPGSKTIGRHMSISSKSIPSNLFAVPHHRPSGHGRRRQEDAQNFQFYRDPIKFQDAKNTFAHNHNLSTRAGALHDAGEIYNKHFRDTRDEEDEKILDENRKKIWAPPADSKSTGGDEAAHDLSVKEIAETINNPEKNWSRSNKYGKKSHENFEKWIRDVGKKYHSDQIDREDRIFDQ